MKRIAALAALLLALLCSLSGMVTGAAPVDPWVDDGATDDIASISDSDVSGSDLAADFVRVPVVPMNVEIPSFYKEVANIAGMYIFTMPDGTIEKRIYGGIDDVYGWYIPVGPNNIVYKGSQPIDVNDDIKMYYAAYEAAGIDLRAEDDFTGLLPPEEGILGMETFFGYPIRNFIFIAFGVTAFLCIIILIVSNSVARHRYRR